ncbi:TIGR03032 family protein [Flammeovirga sp. SubArs3]|uniref:TIGR03032 family protein n=1 Tax=Flammeovirga sp. SubArs3 TaxID=2995316 RepID=UPI00248BE91E|nr:TIGR03032 family protein [Flammeovirga sp. SubArs3]
MNTLQHIKSDGKSLEVIATEGFGNFLKEQQLSIAFTTYQVGKIFMIGLDDTQKISISERTFPRCMGLALKDNSIWMSSLFQVWRFENSVPNNQKYKDYDKIYIPQIAYTTGDIDIHDMIITPKNKPVFVNTRFNCLATTSDTHSFKPLWKPPFISKLVAEDRCHLNGLAAENGLPKYVSMVSQTDTEQGWRDHRKNGGIVMDVQTNEVVCKNLSMPHSPRLHNGKLYLLDAGSGYFGYVDISQKKFIPMTFCNGFIRGMNFIGDYAIVGLSKHRENKAFEGLQLEENLKKHQQDAECGLNIISLKTGEVVEQLRLNGIVRELYDVMSMPNIQKPLVIGTMKDDIQRMITVEN